MRQADIFIFFYLFLLQDSYTLKLSYSPFNIDLFSQSTKLGDFTVLSKKKKKIEAHLTFVKISCRSQLCQDVKSAVSISSN